MKHFKILLVICLALFIAISNTALTKQKSQKPYHKRSKSKTLVKESLDKLKQYLIGFENISFDNIYSACSLIQTVAFHPNSNVFENPVFKTQLINNILSWLGTPYRYGGHSKRGVDCSNFVAIVLHEMLGIYLPANADRQSKLFTPIYDIEELRFGDLIFFTGTNSKSKRIGHVGIYLGNGIFVHSSTGRGVIVTHVSESYYQKRFRFGGRLQPSIFAISSNG